MEFLRRILGRWVIHLFRSCIDSIDSICVLMQCNARFQTYCVFTFTPNLSFAAQSLYAGCGHDCACTDFSGVGLDSPSDTYYITRRSSGIDVLWE
jgi:hypothetical protein